MNISCGRQKAQIQHKETQGMSHLLGLWETEPSLNINTGIDRKAGGNRVYLWNHTNLKFTEYILSSVERSQIGAQDYSTTELISLQWQYWRAWLELKMKVICLHTKAKQSSAFKGWLQHLLYVAKKEQLSWLSTLPVSCQSGQQHTGKEFIISQIPDNQREEFKYVFNQDACIVRQYYLNMELIFKLSNNPDNTKYLRTRPGAYSWPWLGVRRLSLRWHKRGHHFQVQDTYSIEGCMINIFGFKSRKCNMNAIKCNI